jgi:hypothetical protein
MVRNRAVVQPSKYKDVLDDDEETDGTINSGAKNDG